MEDGARWPSKPAEEHRMNETEKLATKDEKQQTVLRAAQDLYAHTPDWVSFFREMLGLNGIVRRNYPTQEALQEFERTETYAEIQQMLTKLRERGTEAGSPQEPTRVITVRLPKSLHEMLRAEAHEHRTSMNKLCISKLLQFIDTQFVPAD
jgi:predicted HicB family RNase H-like nuclease